MQGNAEQQFAPVADRFRQYACEPGYSGQLAVWWRGKPVVDLACGPTLALDSITAVFSVSKGVAGMVVAALIDDGHLGLDAPVRYYWPEFAAAGKTDVTVRQLLSHQAGLPGLEGDFLLDLVLDSEKGAAVLAAQTPLWRPGQAFGYHAFTIGILMEELVRRITGRSLQEIYEKDIRAPRDADFYLGLPEAIDDRYVPVGAPALTPKQQAERDSSTAAPDPVAAFAFKGFGNGYEDGSEALGANNIRMRRVGASAVGGVGSARGLARLYADTLPDCEMPIASPKTFACMSQLQSWGVDRVLNVQAAYGVVFMLPQPRMPYGGLGAFGHDGAGGALAFADPAIKLSFGYIPNPMQYPGGGDYRSLDLARLARECALRVND